MMPMIIVKLKLFLKTGNIIFLLFSLLQNTQPLGNHTSSHEEAQEKQEAQQEKGKGPEISTVSNLRPPQATSFHYKPFDSESKAYGSR